MNRKKLIAIIVVCLILLAAEIAFIVLHPAGSKENQETEPSTQTVQESTSAVEESTGNVTDPAETTVHTTEAETKAPQKTAESEPTPTESEPVPTETEPVPTETEPVPTETEPTPTESEPRPTDAELPPTETDSIPTETETEPLENDDWEGTYDESNSDADEILDGGTEYERYMKMSAEEQEAYFNSFESPDAFFDWYNAAKKEYEDSLGAIELGPDTTIDLENLGS